MRLVVTSDLHYGLKSAGYDRTEEIHRVANHVVDYAIRKEADAFLHLGDLGHIANPTSLIHAMWVELFDKLEQAKLLSYFMLGNHDITTRSANASGSLAVLEELDYQYVQAVVEPRCVSVRGVDLAFLPYPVGEKDVKPPTLRSHPTVVLTHLDVEKAKVNDEHIMRHVSAGIPEQVMKAEEVCYILSGHIHKPQKLSRKHRIVGSPICTDFGDMDRKSFLELVVSKAGKCKVKLIRSRATPLVQLEYDLLNGDELSLDEDAIDRIEGAGVKVKVRCNEDQRQQLDLASFENEVGEYAEFVRPITPTVVRIRDEKRAEITADMSDGEAMAAWLKVRKPSGKKLIRKCALEAMEVA